MSRLPALLITGVSLLIIALNGCGGDQTVTGPQLSGGGLYAYPVWGPNDLIIVQHSPYIDRIDSTGLWLMKADGSEMRPFLTYPYYPPFGNPDWSPDGQWIALDSDQDIYKIRVTGEDLTKLTSGPRYKFFPSWSPDGQWITYSIVPDGPSMEWGIWVVAADGSETKHIRYHLSTTDSINISYNTDWSSLGLLVFTGLRPQGGARHFLILMEDTKRKNARILFDPTSFGYNNGIAHPHFSPDGTKIVFQTEQPGTQDPQIWVINADGRQPRQLTTAGGRHPSWSPDGRHIVYARYSWRYPDQPGNHKLWIMDADGGHKRQLTF